MAPSLDELASKIKEKTSDSNPNMKAVMDGGTGGCAPSPDVTNKMMDTLSTVQNIATKVENSIISPLNGAATEMNLMFDYDRAKRLASNADLNMYVAEQNYIRNIKGDAKYNDLLTNRYKKSGEDELLKTNEKYVNIINLINDLILMLREQEIGKSNMKIVLDNLENKNEKLTDFINGRTTDIYTFNRKSVYESKLRDGVKNWTVIPSIVYWTLLIMWVGIVLVYLRNITYKNIILLVGLILYPYFSTSIILWVLDKIHMIWNFIFIAVRNRVTA
jgi:hypothetical protein